MKKVFNSHSPEETFEFARDFSSKLISGGVVLFKGSLGAGKTLFTKGLVSGLGFDPDEVTSPSFSLVNRYDSDPVCFHLDLWRLDTSSDPAFAVGLDEILENENAVVVIEWSEKLEGFDFGEPLFVVELEGVGESERRITVDRVFKKESVDV
ncbi:MAG: tRNA (adenosine(37)-N6)-threonylcarbamoyltransferase complex ATPase subunit type 1 TsaE [Pyrinomonadaceae bacterium]|nr:tRNA (adenosine(37)-N6)-threonylcarbamoyltransferase complex ATPase subunit type 1 TsaE [Pyrinomonadaceae bacterium]